MSAPSLGTLTSAVGGSDAGLDGVNGGGPPPPQGGGYAPGFSSGYTAGRGPGVRVDPFDLFNSFFAVSAAEVTAAHPFVGPIRLCCWRLPPRRGAAPPIAHPIARAHLRKARAAEGSARR